MLICEGCGVSYDDTFKYCPQCGRGKPHRNQIISSNYIECPSCGHQNIGALHYCQKCGKSIVNNCHQCGNKNPITVVYCGNCGIKLSEAKLTLFQDYAETWSNKFWENIGTKDYYVQGGFVEKSYFPYAKKISELLAWPFPVTMGEDILILAIPVTQRKWCISSLKHNSDEVINGLFEIRRNKIFVYNFHKNSRKYFLYEDLYTTDLQDYCLTLNFRNDNEVKIHFQIEKPSKAGANVISALSIGGSLFGGIFSEVVFDKSNTERQLDSIRDEVRNLNPNKGLSVSEQAYLDYQMELEAVETYVPMFKTFFDEVLRKKRSL